MDQHESMMYGIVANYAEMSARRLAELLKGSKIKADVESSIDAAVEFSLAHFLQEAGVVEDKVRLVLERPIPGVGDRYTNGDVVLLIGKETDVPVRDAEQILRSHGKYVKRVKNSGSGKKIENRSLTAGR